MKMLFIIHISHPIPTGRINICKLCVSIPLTYLKHKNEKIAN